MYPLCSYSPSSVRIPSLSLYLFLSLFFFFAEEKIKVNKYEEVEYRLVLFFVSKALILAF